MTKSFLEPFVLKPENEKLVLDAFSKKNLEKMKVFNDGARKRLKRTAERKLSVSDIF